LFDAKAQEQAVQKVEQGMQAADVAPTQVLQQMYDGWFSNISQLPGKEGQTITDGVMTGSSFAGTPAIETDVQNFYGASNPMVTISARRDSVRRRADPAETGPLGEGHLNTISGRTAAQEIPFGWYLLVRGRSRCDGDADADHANENQLADRGVNVPGVDPGIGRRASTY
jgi:hypothetical protein